MPTLPTGKIFVIDKDHNLFRIDSATLEEEKQLTLTSYDLEMTCLTGDSNWLYIAGGGTNENIIKKVDGSGDMAEDSTHTLTNGRWIRGICQSGDYIYVTCVQDEYGGTNPRVIRLAKSDFSETIQALDTIEGPPNSVSQISTDGINLYVAGSTDHSGESFSAMWVMPISSFGEITIHAEYDTFQSNRVYEDLKGFAVTDLGDRVNVVHHNYLDFVANTSEDTRVYKDYTANHFGNFTHKFKFCIDSSEEGAIAYPYLQANDTLDAKALHDASETFIGVRFIQDGTSSYKLYLHEDYLGIVYESSSLSIALSTFYYCKVTKSGTSLTLDFYSTQTLLDAEGTGDIGQKTLTLHADHSFAYLYAGITYNDGTNKTCDLDIENLAIGELTTPGQIETFYADTTYIYALTTNGMCYKIVKADLTLDSSNYLIPLGPSHTPKQLVFFCGTSWADIYWVTGCTFKHLMKIRTGVWGIEKELADSDGDWTSFLCSIGSGSYVYIGADINEIKKVIISSMSIDSTLALSTGTQGINGMYIS
jgi:WD40 repeat protein